MTYDTYNTSADPRLQALSFTHLELGLSICAHSIASIDCEIVCLYCAVSR